MIEIKKVTNFDMAKDCDRLLTKLIQSERRFDKNTKETFVVSDNYTKKFGDSDKVLYLACDGDISIGFIYGFIKHEKGELVHDTVAHIDALYVSDGYRGKGIASDLIHTFYDWCKNNDVKFVTICVYKNNIDAYNLYYKEGFDTDTYYMTKELL